MLLIFLPGLGLAHDGIMTTPAPQTVPVTTAPDPGSPAAESVVDDCEVCFSMVLADKMPDHMAALHPDVAGQQPDWIRAITSPA
jgi:hypothetical protein